MLKKLNDYLLFDTEDGGGQNKGADAPKPAEIDKFLEKNNYLDGELKKVIKERDDAKSKLREIEDADKIKKGELETLLNDKKTEITNLQTELEKQKSIAAKWSDFEEKKRAKIKELIGDKYKPSMDKLDLVDLEELIETIIPKDTTEVDNGGKPTKPEKTELTEAEKVEAKRMGMDEEYYIQYKETRKKLKGET